MLSRLWIFLLLSVQLLCGGALWLSCFPGALLNVVVTGIFLVVVVFARTIGILLLLLVLGYLIWMKYRRDDPNPHRTTHRASVRQSGRYRRQLAIATGLMVVLTGLLILFDLPQKAAFAISRPAIEAFVADPARVDAQCSSNTPQQFGLYRVEMCDRDPRGGVYFQTDDFGFMFTSAVYGFVYQPNANGSRQFGERGYRLHSIGGDWYWFRAHHDWI